MRLTYQSYSHSQIVTINKDFTYEIVTTEGSDKETEEGTWAWMGKSKSADLKNKEAIVLAPTKETSNGNTDTYDGIATARVMMIDQLKNKEIIFKIDQSYTQSGSTVKTEGTTTFEKK